MTETRMLQVEPATPDALAPFGDIIRVDESGMAKLDTPFYDGKVRNYRPTALQMEDGVEAVVVVIDRRPMEVRWMEQHFKHTQVFIPLAGRPFVAIMAPPNGKDMPDLDDARAFLFDGTAGFAMKVGTWHEFPFPLIDDTQLIVLLRTEATQGLMSEAVIEGEGHSGDLDKKDIVRRTGVTLAARL